MEFQAFKKIARLKRACFVTEKIDGTNGLVGISEPGQIPDGVNVPVSTVETSAGPVSVYAGSRTRWVLPGKSTDNFAFAAWVKENAEDLLRLGPGYHHGEWWGKGIQRGYGLDHRRFSLFNVSRWSGPNRGDAPECCSTVPILYEGDFDSLRLDQCLNALRTFGSLAAPGFDKPEGLVVYHTASGTFFKRTIEGDEVPKSTLVGGSADRIIMDDPHAPGMEGEAERQATVAWFSERLLAAA